MRKQLCRRLDQLETRGRPEAVPALVLVLHPLPVDQPVHTEAGERVVLDHYRNTGLLISARQRTTTDPFDTGRRCLPGQPLEDVIREIHRDCWWRDKGGSCHSCHDTPVAGT